MSDINTQVKPDVNVTYRYKKKVKHAMIEQTIDKHGRKGLRLFLDGAAIVIVPHIEDNIDLSVVKLT